MIGFLNSELPNPVVTYLDQVIRWITCSWCITKSYVTIDKMDLQSFSSIMPHKSNLWRSFHQLSSYVPSHYMKVYPYSTLHWSLLRVSQLTYSTILGERRFHKQIEDKMIFQAHQQTTTNPTKNPTLSSSESAIHESNPIKSFLHKRTLKINN